ncbi:MAG: pyruvate kinase [Sarcina sp.]
MYLIATIGPRTCDDKTIDNIIQGGANTIRINLSHGKYDEIDKVIGYIRRNYNSVKILMDLQGHKIRVSNLLKKEFFLENNSLVYFCSEEIYDKLSNLDCINSNGKIIPLNISVEQIKTFNNSKLYMKDATMRFKVLDINPEGYIKTISKTSGMVRAEKGCNLPGISRDNLELSVKDKKDIQFALNEKVDILCYSYCSTQSDCENFKEEVFSALKRGDKIPRLFAKVETKDAVKNIGLISELLDGVVIARGDLVPESDLYNMPIIQDTIINNLCKKNKEVIVATHVLSTMKKNGSKPSVPELNDIYNMVKKNISGFMLTSETTIGDNQYEIVKTLKFSINYYLEIMKKMKVKK